MSSEAGISNERLDQIEHDNETHLGVCGLDGRVLISALRAAHKELRLWKPMTPEEAEAEMSVAEAEPLSSEEVEAIVKKALDPTERITEPEHVRLALDNAALHKELEAAQAEIQLRDKAIHECSKLVIMLKEAVALAAKEQSP